MLKISTYEMTEKSKICTYEMTLKIKDTYLWNDFENQRYLPMKSATSLWGHWVEDHGCHCCAISNIMLYSTIFWWDLPGKLTGASFNIKMLSYQYRKSHCGAKTIVRSSYLHNGISYTCKVTSLYWIRTQLPHCQLGDVAMISNALLSNTPWDWYLEYS